MAGVIKALSAITPDNPNVYRVGIAVGTGETFEQHVNLELLEQEVRAVLAAGRLWSVGKHFEGGQYSVDFGFVSPPDPSELTTVDGKVAAHNPLAHTPDQQNVIDRGADWAAMRVNAQAMIDQGDQAIVAIGLNHTTLNQVQTDAAAAATLGAFKTAILPWLTITHAILTRQQGDIEALQKVIRASRWFVPPQE